MRARTSTLALLFAALGACADHTEITAAPTPGTVELRVTLPTPDGHRISTQVWLRDAHGTTTFAFLGRDGTHRFENVPAGACEVAAKIPFDVNGPWIYQRRRATAEAGAVTQIHLAVPERRDARLAVAPAKGSPPFLLVLAELGATFPSDLRSLQERLAQQTYPDSLRFAMQSDGHSGLDALPALLPGRYVLMQVAIDGQPGDPPIAARTQDIELRSGATTTVHLEEKLTRMRVE